MLLHKLFGVVGKAAFVGNALLTVWFKCVRLGVIYVLLVCYSWIELRNSSEVH